MDPALFSYLTAQQMATQQLGFPLLQSGAVPMTIQASSLLQPAATTQLIGMDQYFKPASIPTTASPELLLQLLNNNSFGTASMAPSVTIAPPAPVKQQQPLLSLFEQLVAAQQATSLQHPLFVDHASTFAALSVHPSLQQPAAPINYATLMPQTTVHQPMATLQPPIVLNTHDPVTVPTAATVLHHPTALRPKLPQPPTISSITTSLHKPAALHPQPATVPTASTVLQKPTPLWPQLDTVPTTTAVLQKSTAFRPQPVTVATTTPVLHQPIAFRPPPTTVPTPIAQKSPVIKIDSPEPMTSAFRGVTPAAAEQPAAPTVTTSAALPRLVQTSPVKLEVCSPVKTSPSHSDTTPSWTMDTATAATVASSSHSTSVDEDVESMMSGDEEERCRPEDAFAGRQRRADHIAFHRKMKALLKSLRGSDLVCKLCLVKVDRHDNAFKTHIAEHANKGTNQLECRYCGYETPSRVEMNVHMGERHPNGSERAYTDKRDHLKMIEIMNQCFAKMSRPVKLMPKKDPASVKPRMTRKRRLAAEEAAAAAAVGEDTVRQDSFEDTIVRFCTDTQSTEVACACGDQVPLNPSALLAHVKTLHAQYRCNDCGDVLDSSAEAREHTVKMHGGDARSYAERIVDHLVVRSMQQRFMACFIKKETSLEKSLSARVLQNQMDLELGESTKEAKLEPCDIKEEPAND